MRNAVPPFALLTGSLVAQILMHPDMPVYLRAGMLALIVFMSILTGIGMKS